MVSLIFIINFIIIFIINIIFNYIIINITKFWNTIIPNKSPLWQQSYDNLSKFANFLRLFNKICTFITISTITCTYNPDNVLLKLYY